MHMNGRGPINRKKTIVGKASEDSMKTHGEGLGTGPVGASRSEEANRASAAGKPQSRPKPKQPGQSTGSMNTHGGGSGGAARPQQPRPNTGYTRPQQNQQQTRPGTGYTRPQQNQQQTRPGMGFTRPQQTQQSSGGKKGFNPLILIILAVVLLGGGGGLSGLFGGGSNNTDTTAPSGGYGNTATSSGYSSTATSSGYGGSSSGSYSGSSGSYGGGSSYGGGASGLLQSLLGGEESATGASTGMSAQDATGSLFSGYGSDLLGQLLGGSWYGSQTGLGGSTANNTGTPVSNGGQGTLNRSVAPGSRDKYTRLAGGGNDTVTLMIYMCGSDLESRSAMGTRDLKEMAAAKYGDNVRVIVFTGGSKKWQNSLVSNSVNQIWRVQDGGMKCLEKNVGTDAMTKPSTLSGFIKYCAKNYPASRYGLILWDHGSGSVAGYGYDEKNAYAGSMNLAGLNTAFRDGGVKFDFIGYDACLMATVENALMCGNYADYLIASEETEPGIGWYYTNWLNSLGKNTSMSTLDIGKIICDDFVSECNRQCRGQQTTLSVVDLAEVQNTVPGALTGFAKSVSSMISNQEFRSVSNARNGAREFAQSSRIDQVDLTDLCYNLGTNESGALAAALTEAVKYNRSNNITHAYGLSAYFPYKKIGNVDRAVSTYEAIGMDSSYAQAIRDFAGMEASGQAVTGGAGSPFPFLTGQGGGGAAASGDVLGDLLGQFLGGGFSSVSGLSGDNVDFLFGRTMDEDATLSYLSANLLDSAALAFAQDGDNWVLSLTPEQWALVSGVDMNLFYDNGEGYVDLGLDNLFSFDDAGRLVADTSGTWLAINGQPVPYYHESSDYVSDEDWRITGYVPVLLNDERAELLIVFDPEHQSGFVAGARAVYDESQTEMIAKATSQLEDGDTLVFLADLYDYDEKYTDSYAFGSSVTVDGELRVGDVFLPDISKCLITYRVTDIYNQTYWTPVVGK